MTKKEIAIVCSIIERGGNRYISDQYFILEQCFPEHSKLIRHRYMLPQETIEPRKWGYWQWEEEQAEIHRNTPTFEERQRAWENEYAEMIFPEGHPRRKRK